MSLPRSYANNKPEYGHQSRLARHQAQAQSIFVNTSTTTTTATPSASPRITQQQQQQQPETSPVEYKIESEEVIHELWLEMLRIYAALHAQEEREARQQASQPSTPRENPLSPRQPVLSRQGSVSDMARRFGAGK
jgi:hypothetical protein